MLISLAPQSFARSAEDSTGSQIRPNVYLDCWFCDFDYIRTEIPYVNYVYDRTNADIHVLITRQHTGSGGRRYTLIFLGQRKFSSRQDTASFVTLHDESQDEIRRKLSREIEMGLLPFLYNTEIMKDLSISYEGTSYTLIKADKWKQWFFRINFSGFFDGEATASSHSFTNRISAEHITLDWKIRISSRLSSEKDTYEIDDKTLSSSESHKRIRLFIVRSITDHWSAGMNNQFFSSTHDNISAAFRSSPGIEYNFFPYSESVMREFRILYEIGLEYDHYYQETIFNKMSEELFQESVELAYATKNPWGRIDLYVNGSHYFHDLTKNYLSVYGEISLRLIKGFSLYIEGGYSRIRDQLSLPKTDATIEQILLRRRQLATQFNYWGEIGLEFSFGSLYNNIVNPRFGD